MARIISLDELEAVINRVRRVAPPVGGVLSPALRELAQLYGMMIHERAQSIDIDGLGNDTGHIIRKWLPPHPTGGVASTDTSPRVDSIGSVDLCR